MPRKKTIKIEVPLVIPKPGELVRTNHTLCSNCVYGTAPNCVYGVICEYSLITHRLRGCRCGWCNNFKLQVGRRKVKHGKDVY